MLIRNVFAEVYTEKKYLCATYCKIGVGEVGKKRMYLFSKLHAMLEWEGFTCGSLIVACVDSSVASDVTYGPQNARKESRTSFLVQTNQSPFVAYDAPRRLLASPRSTRGDMHPPCSQ